MSDSQINQIEFTHAIRLHIQRYENYLNDNNFDHEGKKIQQYINYFKQLIIEQGEIEMQKKELQKYEILKTAATGLSSEICSILRMTFLSKCRIEQFKKFNQIFSSLNTIREMQSRLENKEFQLQISLTDLPLLMVLVGKYTDLGLVPDIQLSTITFVINNFNSSSIRSYDQNNIKILKIR